jgi:AraC-like DNA-binding protein
MPATRLLACAPGTIWERWLREVVSAPVTVVVADPDALLGALDATTYAGLVLLVCPRILALWQAVRDRLVLTRTPAVLFTPLAPEPLYRLAFERELHLVGLHVVGIDDHPRYVRASIDRLLRDGTLQRLLDGFASHRKEIGHLVLPCWEALATIRSLDEWAALVNRTPRELRVELHRVGIRSPRRFLTWLRLLAAWPRLQAGSPGSVVALEVGYSAPPALTRSARHFAGLPPSQAASLPVENLIDRLEADLVA